MNEVLNQTDFTLDECPGAMEGELVGNINEDQHCMEEGKLADHLVLEARVAWRIPYLQDGIWVGQSQSEEGEVLCCLGVSIGDLVNELRHEGSLASAWIAGQHDFE
jgi:hypothetical protein